MRKRERNKMRWEIDMEIGVESKVPATSTFATWNVLQRNKTVAVAVPSRGWWDRFGDSGGGAAKGGSSDRRM